MTSYKIELSKKAMKFIGKAEKATKDRISNALVTLSEDPYSYTGAAKLVGTDNEYRIRIGKLRMVYGIRDDVLIIIVLDIDSRGDIYRF